MPTGNIIFDEVDVQIDKTTGIPGGVYDRRPANVEGFVKGRTSAFPGNLNPETCNWLTGNYLVNLLTFQPHQLFNFKPIYTNVYSLLTGDVNKPLAQKPTIVFIFALTILQIFQPNIILCEFF